MASGCGKFWEVAAVGDIEFYGRTVIRGIVTKAGESVLPWHRKTCAIEGNMGMVAVIEYRKMEMVSMGGDAVEMQNYKGIQRDE